MHNNISPHKSPTGYCARVSAPHFAPKKSWKHVNTFYLIAFINGLILFQTAISIPTPGVSIQIGVVVPILSSMVLLTRYGLFAMGAMLALSATLSILSAMATTFDLKFLYFIAANVSIVTLFFLMTRNIEALRGVIDGALIGVLLSAFVGLLLCSTGGCGYGNDTNFSLAVNPNRLYGFNAEASILAPQLMAVCSVLILKVRRTHNPLHVFAVGFTIFALAMTSSSQAVLLPVFIAAAFSLKDMRKNRIVYLILVSITAFILALPLLMTAIELVSRQFAHMEVFGRDLHRDIIASSKIRFASVLSGWSIIHQNPLFGSGFEKDELAHILNQYLGNFDKAGIDNYLVARTSEFGLLYALLWIVGGYRMICLLGKKIPREGQYMLLFFSVLSTMSLSSTGYLGIYYYAFPLVFVIPGMTDRVKRNFDRWIR